MADTNETTTTPAAPPANPDPPAAPPDPEKDDLAVDPVSEAAKRVAETEAQLASAKAAHAEEVKKATPPEPEPELGRHVLVDLNAAGSFSLLEIATTPDLKGYDAHNPPRQINVFGVSCEHVSDHQPSGVWCYRSM